MDCDNVEVVEALGASNAAQQRHHDGARGGQLVDGVDVAAVVEAAPEDAPAEKRAVLVAHVGHRHQLLVLDVGGGVRRAAPARPVQAAVEHVAPAVAAVALAAGVALRRHDGQGPVEGAEQHARAAPAALQLLKPELRVSEGASVQASDAGAGELGTAVCSAKAMHEGPAAAHDAAGEAELADQRVQVLGAARAGVDGGAEQADQLGLAGVANGNRARGQVENVPDVLGGASRRDVLVGVDAETQPGEERLSGGHAASAVGGRRAYDGAVVNVHRACDAGDGQELDHLAAEGGGERRRELEAERDAPALPKRRDAHAGGLASGLEG